MAGEVVVYRAKRIRTGLADAPHTSALAVSKGRIVAVGAEAEALKSTRNVHWPDAVIVPGLVDAHAHLHMLGKSLVVARLNDAESAEDAGRILKRAGNDSRQGEWWVGQGWNQTKWPGEAFPTKAVLDALFPDAPVYLTRIDGHAAWLNSEALRRAGITAATVEVPGGRMVRDARGEPTGVLVDNAMDSVAALIPPPTQAQFEHRLRRALERCATLGLTGIHDAGVDLRTFETLRAWDEQGQLPLRVFAMAFGQGADEAAFLARGTYEGERLRMKTVKFLADGALGSRGAALHAPYSDEPSQSGLLLLSEEALEAKAKAFCDAGFQVAIHAIGDLANTLALNVLERLPPKRHRVEHAQILVPRDLPRFARAGLIASVQPTHATSDWRWAQARLGAERLKGAYAWRSLLDSGARVAFGSDFPIEGPNPLLGLFAARTRQDAGLEPAGGWLPQECVTGEEALSGFTSGAAYAEFAEGQRGTLAVGMDADFTALSVDPVDEPAPALLSARAVATVVAGNVIFVGKAEPTTRA